MLTIKVLRLVALASLLACSAMRAEADAPLRLEITLPKKTYSLRQEVAFYITFKNVSDRDLRILPEVGLYRSALVSIRKVGSRSKVEYLRPNVESHLDLDALAKYVVLRMPGD